MSLKLLRSMMLDAYLMGATFVGGVIIGFFPKPMLADSPWSTKNRRPQSECMSGVMSLI